MAAIQSPAVRRPGGFVGEDQRQLAPYEQLCVAMFVRFAKPGSAYEADVTAKTCLLMPVPSLDPGQIAPWADLAVTLGADDGYAFAILFRVKALAAYRSPAAIARRRRNGAEKAIASAQTQAQAQRRMGCCRCPLAAGGKETARVMLKRGEAPAPAVLPTREREDPGQAWLAWLYARVSSWNKLVN
ncbi:MAG: hypothetical protein U1G07_13540 [Verrucomicrobiota bacterium]